MIKRLVVYQYMCYYRGWKEQELYKLTWRLDSALIQPQTGIDLLG